MPFKPSYFIKMEWKELEGDQSLFVEFFMKEHNWGLVLVQQISFTCMLHCMHPKGRNMESPLKYKSLYGYTCVEFSDQDSWCVEPEAE